MEARGLHPIRPSIHVGAGRRYRLGEHVFRAPNWAGPLSAMMDGIVKTALLPFTLVLPGGEPDGPPTGEHFAWIIDRENDQLVAGTAPGVHQAITDVPIEDENE